MSEPFLAEIVMFGGNFAPRGWAFCDGQLLPIAQNSALFSLLGTMYGGDGRTTFGLPDFRGRVPISAGNGPGLPSYQQGQKGGVTQVTLQTGNMPSHNHAVSGGTANMTGSLRVSSNTSIVEDQGAAYSIGVAEIYVNAAPDTTLHPDSVEISGVISGLTTGLTGNNIPFLTMSPYCTVRFIIALQGIFPPRS